MSWESINSWFNRKELREQHEAARLRKLESLMQDFPGRPLTQTVAASELGKFTQRAESAETLERNERRARGEYSLRGDRSFEVESARMAEELRKTFRPKTAPAKHRRHVRPPSPVRADVAALARLLGVSI